MYKPSTYLVIAYFSTYIQELFDGIGYQGWNQILTQLRFIHNWVIRGIQWMVCWWVLVHCGRYVILMVVPHLHQTGVIIGSHFSQNWDENSTEEKTKRTKLVFVKHIDPQRNFSLIPSFMNSANQPIPSFMKQYPISLIWLRHTNWGWNRD
jgi:hypothetical protein